jgi:hypothetical protein
MYTYDSSFAERLFDTAIEIVMDPKMGPQRGSLGSIVSFRAPHDTQAALEAASKIPDPYYRADALISVVTQGNLPADEAMEVLTEAKTLLASDSGNALARGYALLKLMDVHVPEHLNLCELLWDVIQTTRRTQPIDWFETIGLLVETHRRFKNLGDQEAADETLSEALDRARDDPFRRSEGMAQVAQAYLNFHRPKALDILYEILRLARLEGYGATWTAITAIIPVMCELGGSAMAQHVYSELDVAEGFVPSANHRS